MHSSVMMSTTTRAALCSGVKILYIKGISTRSIPLKSRNIQRYIPRSSSSSDNNDSNNELKQEDDQKEQPEFINEDNNKNSSGRSPPLQLPNSIISRLRDTVFTFDTFFVTSVENYAENGVLFKGNLRGNTDPQTTYSKLSSRLTNELGNEYTLYLLEDQEENPVVVVIPTEAAQQQVNEIGELSLAVLLALTTVATTLNVMGDTQLFNAALLTVNLNDVDAIKSALPGTIATLLILLAHETGHLLGAKRANLELAPPVLIPAGLGLLGSFGAITRIKGIVKDRQSLVTVTAPGPLCGSLVSLILLGAGFLLTVGGIGGIEVNSASFRESLLVGGIANLVFGEKIFTAAALNCNPLLVAGWGGLIINAINCIPAGELDGGRLALGLFGRRSASRMSSISLFLLGVLGFSNSLSLFWLLLVLTLQRGPVIPCLQEVTGIEDKNLKIAGIVALMLPLLVFIPYPVSSGLEDLPPF